MTTLNPIAAQRIIDMTIGGLTIDESIKLEDGRLKWEDMLDDAAIYTCDDFYINDDEFTRDNYYQARALIYSIIVQYEQDPKYYKRVLYIHNELNSYDDYEYEFPGELKRYRETSIRKCFNEQSQPKHRKTIT
jgi:hypothetical protein